VSRTLTQRAVRALKPELSAVPVGAPVDVRALLAATGIPARAALVVRRLREAGWIVSDGRRGWRRTAPAPRGHRRSA
jgi:hypothetical protein